MRNSGSRKITEVECDPFDAGDEVPCNVEIPLTSMFTDLTRAAQRLRSTNKLMLEDSMSPPERKRSKTKDTDSQSAILQLAQAHNDRDSAEPLMVDKGESKPETHACRRDPY